MTMFPLSPVKSLRYGWHAQRIAAGDRAFRVEWRPFDFECCGQLLLRVTCDEAPVVEHPDGSLTAVVRDCPDCGWPKSASVIIEPID